MDDQRRVRRFILDGEPWKILLCGLGLGIAASLCLVAISYAASR